MEVSSANELLDASARGVVTLGSHSWSHPNLATLDAVALRKELDRALKWTTSVEGGIPWLAYPYGIHDDRVAKAAHAAGYVGAVTVEGGGLLKPPAPDLSDPFRTPRLNVPAGCSTRGLRLRLSPVALGR